MGIILTGPESESTGDGDCEYPLDDDQTPTAEPHDIDSPFANLSVNPLIGEDQTRIRSYSSYSIRLAERSPSYFLSPAHSSINTPTSSKSDPRDPTRSAQKHGLNNNTHRLSPFSCPKHRAHSAGATPQSKDTLMGRNVQGEVPGLRFSAYNAKQSRNHIMAQSGPSFSSQARAAELNAASAARARNFNRRIEDVNNLALPKSASVGSLTSKAHTRNRRPKAWRPPGFEGSHEASPPGILAGRNHPSMNPALQAQGHVRFDQLNPGMALHPLRSVSGMEAHEYRNIPTGPRRRSPHWLHGMNSHTQANMFGSPGHYGPAHGNPFPPHHCKQAAISTPKAFVNLRGIPLFGPDDISPAKQEEKSAFRGVQNGIVSQNPLQDDTFMAGQPYHPYGPPPLPFTPQPDLHIAYGYGPPVYSPQSGQVDLDYHFISQDAHSEDNQYIAYAPAPPLAPQMTGLTEPRTYGMTATGSTANTDAFTRMETPLSIPSVPEHPSVMAESKALQLFENKPRMAENSDTKRDMTAFLNSVVEASKAKMEIIERNETLHPKDQHVKLAEPHGTKTTGPQHFLPVYLSSSHSQQPTNVLSCDAGTRQAVLAQLTSASGFGKCPRVNVKDAKPGNMESFLSIPMPEKFDIPSNAGENPAFKFPPPGLPFPKSIGSSVSLGLGDEPKPPPGSRLEQSNQWFHTDNRGYQHDRLRVASITKQDSLRRETARSFGLQTNNDILADASNVLLGGVLVNLNTYLVGDPRAQFGNFAKFGDVPIGACESSIGGNRTFFDYGPSGSWGLPLSLSEHRYQQRMDGNGASEARTG